VTVFRIDGEHSLDLVASGMCAGQLAKDHPFALAVADRTGTDTQRDLYRSLVAASVTAVAQVAVSAFMNASPPVPIVPLLRQALAGLAAGLPDPSAAEPPMSGRQK
jgi:hypothetical protein